MEKHYFEYLQLLKKLWSDTLSGTNQSIFFNTSRKIEFASFMDRVLPHFSPPPLVLRADIRKGTFHPFFPFLYWIEDALKGMSEEDILTILKKAGVYYFHQDILLSYFKNHTAQRHERLLDDEVLYEKSKMRQSIFDLFLFLLGKEPSFIIIENVHNIPESTSTLLDQHLLNQSNLPFLFIFSIDKDQRNNEFKDKEQWNRMYDIIQRRSILLDFKDPESGSDPPAAKIEPLDLKSSIRESENAYQLLAFEDCRKMILTVYTSYYKNHEKLELEYECRMLRLMGNVHYMLGEYDKAYIHYHALLNTSQQHSLTDDIIYAFQMIGFIHLQKEDLEAAEKMSRQSLKLAKEIGDEKASFYSLKLNFLIEDKGRRQDIASWKKLFYRILDLAEKLGMVNSLAAFATNPFGQYSRMDEDIEVTHKKGAQVARKYGNEFRLAAAFQTMGLVQAVKGNYSEVIRLYQKSKRLKSRLNHPLEMSYAYNGLGYYYFMIGNYKSADKHFYLALQLLKQVKDYHEIAMTFFNLAYTYFFSFKFEWSIDFLEKTLYLMDVLNLKNLAYHSLFGIYSLLGVSYCKSGQYAKAYEYWTRIQVMQLAPYTAKNEEYFMFYLLNAYLKAHEGHPGLAIFYYNGAEHYLNKTNDIIKYMGPYFCYDYGSFLQEQEMKDKAAALWAEGIQRSRELGNGFYSDLLQMIQKGDKTVVSPFKNKLRGVDFEWIIESAKMQNTLTILHKKYDEIHFLNSFQNLLSQYEGHDLLIQKAIDHMHNSFLVDSVYYHIYQSGEWVELYSRHSSQPLLTDNRHELISYLIDNSLTYVPDINQEEKLVQMKLWINSIISFPLSSGNKWHGHILCLTSKDNHQLSQEDMEVLSLAVKQLLSALEKIDQKRQILLNMQKLNALNKRLQQAAVTDILTKLYNRNALLEKLDQEIGRIRRYGKDSDVTFSVLFIDLDNFKYYNDSFGHHVGDMLLVKFGNILESAGRDIDFISRYGGDEFVCVLPETKENGAISLSRRIFELLKSQDYFQKDIEEYIGHPINIPPHKQLNCSIGISTYHKDNLVSSNDILKQSDTALYQSKEKGKGTWSVYQNIK